MAKTRKVYFFICRVMCRVDWYICGQGILLHVVISFTDGNSTILRCDPPVRCFRAHQSREDKCGVKNYQLMLLPGSEILTSALISLVTNNYMAMSKFKGMRELEYLCSLKRRTAEYRGM